MRSLAVSWTALVADLDLTDSKGSVVGLYLFPLFISAHSHDGCELHLAK